MTLKQETTGAELYYKAALGLCQGRAILNGKTAPWRLGHPPILFPLPCHFQKGL